MKKSKKSVLGRLEDISSEEINSPELLEEDGENEGNKSPIRNAKKKRAEKEAVEKLKEAPSDEPAGDSEKTKKAKPAKEKPSKEKPAKAEPAITKSADEKKIVTRNLIVYIVAVLIILVFVVLKLYNSVGWQKDLPTYILAFILIAVGCSISPVTNYIIYKHASAKVIKANPYYLAVTFKNDKSARNQLINALMSSAEGNSEKTESMLEKLLEKCSTPQEYASIYTIMGGNAAKNSGDAQKAIEYYEKAIARDEGFGGAWYGLAVAHMRLDDLRPAKEELSRARECGYDRSKVRRALEVVDEMLEDDSRVLGAGAGYSTTAKAVEDNSPKSDSLAGEEFLPSSRYDSDSPIANEIAPFVIFERNGNSFASLNIDGSYKAEIFAARAADGFIGSGYDWENLAKVLINEEMQEFDGVINFDSEAGMFTAYSRNRVAIESFILAFAKACRDDAKMADLLSRAMPA